LLSRLIRLKFFSFCAGGEPFLLVKHLSEAELEALIRHEKSKRLVERLIFIRSLYADEEVKTAANKLGRCRATGYLWLRRWNNGGLEALTPEHRKGMAPKLPREKQEELKQMLQKQGYWTTKEAKAQIEERFGVCYSLRSVSRLLRRLGMRYAKPYPRDYRRPSDAETKLKSALEVSLEKLEDLEAEENVLVGFLDECSPQTAANTVRVWSFGKALIVKDTTKYRANTFGFYAPYGRSVVGFKENSKKESVCKFIEEIRECNPEKKILLVLDNFPSHKAQATREKAEELGVLLTYLPPYSPDLNPIEQVWRCLKREISTAFFRSRDEFLALITKSYSQLSTKLSFAKGWIEKFLPQQSNQLCL
jgi:transposase